MSDTNKNLVGRHFEEIWDQRKMAACNELMADFPSMGCATSLLQAQPLEGCPYGPGRAGQLYARLRLGV